MTTILGVNLYTAEETAELLGGVTTQTIRNYTRKGLLTPTLIGKTKHFSEEQIREYLKRGKPQQTKEEQGEKE